MKKSMKGEVVLSACQVQATRLNKLEYHRLQNHVNIMEDNLKFHLTHLQRQAQNLKYHYTNVVRVVKPNPKYDLWKQKHAHEIAREQPKTRLGLIKPKTTRRQFPPFNGQSIEPVRPLLLLIDNQIEKPVEPIINFSHNFLRPKSTPMKKHNSNTLMTMFNEPSTTTIHTKTSETNSNLFAPILSSTNNLRKSTQNKFHSQQKTPNIDTLYRIALQNQTACNSIERTHIDKRKLLDKEFASQHRALRGTIRSAGLVH